MLRKKYAFQKCSPLLLQPYVFTEERFDYVLMQKVSRQKLWNAKLNFLSLSKCYRDNDSTKKYILWLCLSYIHVLSCKDRCFHCNLKFLHFMHDFLAEILLL